MAERKSLKYLIDYHKKTQSNILSNGTLAHYKTTEKYLMDFLSSVKKADDVYIEEIDYQFITEFEHYLRSFEPKDHQRPMSHNVVMKHMTRLRKMLNMATKLEWIPGNAFNRYAISYTKVDRGHLTELELQTIISKK
ncbi:phage integrase SAM-like domain-containing protein [Plebeiibacterium marinum]|uniref:Phage integrase SAM-like domain-containing protein n=1 Tax=Plebeiibacterium marinum TaxID=2992111 RepID=A0AAE3MIJ4_9BACT|nr:phage integrase SAM-like domain-containing protein [Plebeiobacterium marinum]MCW3808096.1 phage integrase SAM-like domain-containing protein [Plebeiobacterium marinum]